MPVTRVLCTCIATLTCPAVFPRISLCTALQTKSLAITSDAGYCCLAVFQAHELAPGTVVVDNTSR